MEKIIPDSIYTKYEIHDYRHAVEIISSAYTSEWKDIIDLLESFSISKEDLSMAGGSETNIPGKIDSVLSPRKWKNVQVSGELHVRFYDRIIDRKMYADFPSKESIIPNYLFGQQVDYLKSRVALYLEWNKKDLAFDKTLSDIRMLYDANLISAAVIITRGEDLNDAFKDILDSEGKPIARKYGASSTWTGRLLPRLDARAAGGCPVLALGIRKACIEDYK